MNVLFFMIFVIIIDQLKVVNGINVYMNENISAVAGEDGIEIKCSYTKENVKTIFTVAFFARNKTTQDNFFSIVTFLPGDATVISPSGEYLRDRVTMTNITQESTEAALIFNEIKCTDQNQYRCKVMYLNTNNDAVSGMSLPTTINVTVKPQKPHISCYISQQNNNNIDKRSILPNGVINRTSINQTTNANDHKMSSVSSARVTSEKEQFPREGDNITFVCSGNVGRPPGNIMWQIIYTNENTLFKYVNGTMHTEPFEWKCSLNRTRYLSIQLSANDFNARIRCFVVSHDGHDRLYVDTEPLNFHFGVRHVSINKLPDKQRFDTTIKNITLICNGNGNPKPTYVWYKRKNTNTILSISNKYVINNVIKNNSGTYICEVYNFISEEKYNASTSVEITVVENTKNIGQSSTNHSSTEVSTIVAVLCGLLAVIIIVLVSWIFHSHKCIRNNKNNNSAESNSQEMNNYNTIDDISSYEKTGPLDQRPYNELGQIFIREDCKDENRTNNKNNDPTKSNDRATYSYDTIEDRTTYERPGPQNNRPYNEIFQISKKEDFEDENRKYLTVISDIQEKEQENIIKCPEDLIRVGHSYSNLQF